MASDKYIDSRRSFLRTLGAGATLLSSGVMIPRAYSKNAPEIVTTEFSFRKSKPPLLLNFNENSLGMSPKASAAAQLATINSGNRYPDAALNELRSALAEQHGVNKEQVIFGNGSTEVIQAVITVAAGLGATVIEPSPTFGDVRRYSQAEGLKVVQIPVGEDFKTSIIDLKNAADKHPGALLINVCNPNNPTGTIVDQKALVAWVKAAPENHLFLIDEAYFDYAQLNPNYDSMLPLIKAGKENLIITRTFSKIYGMAGMRFGYGLAAEKTAKEVRKFAAGYNLSTTAIAAAMASMADKEFYARSIASNQDARAILLSALDELKLEHIDSNTNFVLHKIGTNLEQYSSRMQSNGVKVGRRMTKDDGWNRLSLGTPNEMQEFVKTLKAFREQGWV